MVRIALIDIVRTREGIELVAFGEEQLCGLGCGGWEWNR